MLGESIRAALPELRAHAESRMGVDNGGSNATLWRRVAREEQDESNGSEAPEWLAVHLSLPCRIGSDRGSAPTRTINTPGGEMQVGARTAHFPVDTYDLADGDLIEIIAGRLIDTVWQIAEADDADQQTARRVPVVAVDRPEEWS